MDSTTEPVSYLSEMGIKPEDSEKMFNGFVYYLSETFKFNRIDLEEPVYRILSFFNEDDNEIFIEICLYSYLYFCKYIEKEPKVIELIKQISDLLYFLLLMVYLASLITYDKQFAIKDVMRSFRVNQELFISNLFRVMSQLNFRLSIEALLVDREGNLPKINSSSDEELNHQHNLPDINTGLEEEFDRPYGDIIGHCKQLLSWG